MSSNITIKNYRVRYGGIYYWQTAGGAEVDFVAEITPHVFPFEVTYSANIKKNKVKNLSNFLATKSKARIGYYLYFGDYSYDPTLNLHSAKLIVNIIYFLAASSRAQQPFSSRLH